MSINLFWVVEPSIWKLFVDGNLRIDICPLIVIDTEGGLLARLEQVDEIDLISSGNSSRPHGSSIQTCNPREGDEADSMREQRETSLPDALAS